MKLQTHSDREPGLMSQTSKRSIEIDFFQCRGVSRSTVSGRGSAALCDSRARAARDHAARAARARRRAAEQLRHLAGRLLARALSARRARLELAIQPVRVAGDVHARPAVPALSRFGGVSDFARGPHAHGARVRARRAVRRDEAVRRPRTAAGLHEAEPREPAYRELWRGGLAGSRGACQVWSPWDSRGSCASSAARSCRMRSIRCCGQRM